MKIDHILSVREPFAHLLVSGIKTVENRSVAFPAKLPRPCWVAIHASLSLDDMYDVDMMNDLCDLHPEIEEAWNSGYMPPEDDIPPALHPRIFGRSEIIGAVEFLGSVPFGDEDAEKEPADVFTGYDDPDRYDGWANGPHAWLAGRAIRFSQPIVTLGRLGVRPMPADLAGLVAKASETVLANPGEAYGRPIIHALPKLPKRQLEIYQV